MWMYAITTFLSAFLLFQIQPLIAKLILPWYGGTSAVWTSSLMFFQVFLLLGYCYAHLLVRFAKPKWQTTIHFGLLLASLLALPIIPSADWKPSAVGNPSMQIAALLTVTIGAPYLLLSATCPLLQVWYVRRTDSQVPQRLFVLSNVGSLLALVSYPFLMEPSLASHMQANVWSLCYALFTLLCGLTAKLSHEPLESASTVIIPAADAPRPGIGQKILWVGLAACASALLAGTTNHLTTNLAQLPLLWVGPLAIYLVTFMLAFQGDGFYRPAIFAGLALPTLALMGYTIYLQDGNLRLQWAMPPILIGLFLCCLLCHGEIARRRPAAPFLTSYYLLIALGGAVGGICVALIAPAIFATPIELPITLVAVGILAIVVFWNLTIPFFEQELGAWPNRAAMILGVAAIGYFLADREVEDRARYLLIERNFYSTLRVRDINLGTSLATRQLLHGTISHGSQRLTGNPDAAIAYYAPSSGVGRALEELQSHGPIKYGVIGLGAGVLTGYAREEDSLRVYEINPKVSEIATREFTYYGDTKADKKILLGDARLTLESQPKQGFDLLVVDAFSSDSIPVHLLTKEALELYCRHMKPGGIMAMHISNRYLNLVPVLARAAEQVHRVARVVEDPGDSQYMVYPTTWVLIAPDPHFFDSPRFANASVEHPLVEAGFHGWTDDFSSLWPMVTLGF